MELKIDHDSELDSKEEYKIDSENDDSISNMSMNTEDLLDINDKENYDQANCLKTGGIIEPDFSSLCEDTIDGTNKQIKSRPIKFEDLNNVPKDALKLNLNKLNWSKDEDKKISALPDVNSYIQKDLRLLKKKHNDFN